MVLSIILFFIGVLSIYIQCTILFSNQARWKGGMQNKLAKVYLSILIFLLIAWVVAIYNQHFFVSLLVFIPAGICLSALRVSYFGPSKTWY